MSGKKVVILHSVSVTVHLKTACCQIHFVLTFANRGRVEDRRSRERRWTGSERMTGMGTWSHRDEGERIERTLFWFFTNKTNRLIKTYVSNRAQHEQVKEC